MANQPDPIFLVNPKADASDLHNELHMLLVRIEALCIAQDDGNLANHDPEAVSSYFGTIQHLAERGREIQTKLHHIVLGRTRHA